MHSLLRRLLIAAVCLGALALILFVADVELAEHHSQTHASTTASRTPALALPAHPTLFVYVDPTEPPSLRTRLAKPLTRQLEARGISVRWLSRPPKASERPAVHATLHAAPLTWTPLHADATVTVRLALKLEPGAQPDAGGGLMGAELTVKDVTSGLTSRPAYLRYLAETSARAIADALEPLLQPASAPR